MLDRARVFASEVDAYLEHLNEEVRRWTLLREGLDSLISAGAAVPTVPATAPAVVPLPPGDDSPAIDAPEQGARRPTPVRVGSPAPVSRSTTGRAVHPTEGWVECPECGERVRAQGLGAHRSRSKRHAAVIAGEPRTPITVVRQTTPAARNPRSTPPLDLPARLDRAVGE